MFFGGGGIPLGIDPKDMNKENIDEENILLFCSSEMTSFLLAGVSY